MLIYGKGSALEAWRWCNLGIHLYVPLQSKDIFNRAWLITTITTATVKKSTKAAAAIPSKECRPAPLQPEGQLARCVHLQQVPAERNDKGTLPLHTQTHIIITIIIIITTTVISIIVVNVV